MNGSSVISEVVGGSNYMGLKFRENGLREPPLFIANNNLIIMIVGLSMLIVPVVGFLVCMCAKSKFLRGLKTMKLTSGGGQESGSGLPYSHFESEGEDYEPRKVDKIVKSVRVLLDNDNTTAASGEDVPKKGPVRSVPSKNSNAASEPSVIVDVDATFVLPRESSDTSNAKSTSSYS